VSLSPSAPREPPLNFAEILTTESVFQDGHKMVLRYSDAIRAYAAALLGNAEEAEDIHLDLLGKMLDGDFSGPTQKGRFRFFVKRAVRNAVLDHLKKRSRETNRLRRLWNAVVKRRPGKPTEEPAELPSETDLEQQEREIWRASVLRRAMEELEKYERAHQERAQPNLYHTVARLLVDHPGDTSDDLAGRLGAAGGGNFNATQVRGIVLRMRRKFAELLFTEISQHFPQPTYDDVVEEMGQLSLLSYAQPYLPANQPGSAGA
jgi:DNA-directed RNA polymerase specialized sigma24 family protein